MANYRKIYELHHGSIPIGSNGKTYEIHHIDGNSSNNDISNLIAVSIEEHYNIHFKEGNMRACNAIALRMDKSKEEIKLLATLAAKERVRKKTHHWIGGELQKKWAQLLKEKGKLYFCSKIHSQRTSERNKLLVSLSQHVFQSEKHRKIISESNRVRLQNGTHPFLNGVGAKNSRERIKNGTHHFLNKDKQHELSIRSKMKNSFHVVRTDANGFSQLFIGIVDAVKATPGANWRRVKKSAIFGHNYLGYDWKIINDKDISSTTISKESTD